jgi:hypothetical protein
MAVTRMDNVGSVVEDIEAAIEIVTELDLELEARAHVEGDGARSSSATWCCGAKTCLGSATSGVPSESSSGSTHSSDSRRPGPTP